MKFLILNICLLSAAVSSFSGPSSRHSNGSVCGALYGYTKTFKNYREFYNDYIDSGKLWSLLYAGPCTTKSECKKFSPVCGVSKNNVYRTFVNICAMKGDHKKTGTTWRLLSNGFCSKPRPSRHTRPSKSARLLAARLLSSHPKHPQKHAESSATFKRSPQAFTTLSNSPAPSSFPLAQLANMLLLLGVSGQLPETAATTSTSFAFNPSPSNTLPFRSSVPSAPYQTIFNNAVYQGEFNYEPKKNLINFGDMNFLPLNYSLSSLTRDSVLSIPPNSVVGSSGSVQLPTDSVISTPTTSESASNGGAELKGPVTIANEALKEGLENIKTFRDLAYVDRFLGN